MTARIIPAPHALARATTLERPAARRRTIGRAGTGQPETPGGTNPRLAVASPSPLLLSSFTALRREPTRPPEFRDAAFADRFDDDTLFYDAVRERDGRIALLGPAFHNLEGAIRMMGVTALPGGATCRFRVRTWDRHGQVLVQAPEGTTHLRLDLAFGSVEIAVAPHETDVFAGRRTVFTLSRNNRLDWVQDWLRFARDIHGADAALVYDNASSAYSTEELLRAIGAVDGIAVARVVPWPFRYGPQGLDAHRFWDSDFCQHGAWEDARRRFLQAAAGAQNADIDEMVLIRSGQTVFEVAAADAFGVARYGGRWVAPDGAVEPSDPAPSHRDHRLVKRQNPVRRFGILRRDANACPPKWTVVPARIPDRVQWRAHSLGSWLPARRLSTGLGYRHFMAVTDNWKYQRTDDASDAANRYEADHELAAHFAHVDWRR